MSFKYFPKADIYKASNNYIQFSKDKNNFQAVSYGWWTYATKINGLVVFNKYAYSATTQRHQQKMKALLAELGIEIDVYVNTPKSIDDWTAANVINNLKVNIEETQKELTELKRLGTRKHIALTSKLDGYLQSFRKVS